MSEGAADLGMKVGTGAGYIGAGVLGFVNNLQQYISGGRSPGIDTIIDEFYKAVEPEPKLLTPAEAKAAGKKSMKGAIDVGEINGAEASSDQTPVDGVPGVSNAVARTTPGYVVDYNGNKLKISKDASDNGWTLRGGDAIRITRTPNSEGKTYTNIEIRGLPEERKRLALGAGYGKKDYLSQRQEADFRIREDLQRRGLSPDSSSNAPNDRAIGTKMYAEAMTAWDKQNEPKTVIPGGTVLKTGEAPYTAPNKDPAITAQALKDNRANVMAAAMQQAQLDMNIYMDIGKNKKPLYMTILESKDIKGITPEMRANAEKIRSYVDLRGNNPVDAQKLVNDQNWIIGFLSRENRGIFNQRLQESQGTRVQPQKLASPATPGRLPNGDVDPKYFGTQQTHLGKPVIITGASPDKKSYFYKPVQ
jgi:hypothetical protein